MAKRENGKREAKRKRGREGVSTYVNQNERVPKIKRHVRLHHLGAKAGKTGLRGFEAGSGEAETLFSIQR